ncbi:hypothetical protein F0562_010476 [Nyssa sinensis]|uniref:Uncharacterized protein n=1 Tax=Nyssa sinensis TaxID=561372 RepID=A0A5J4ZZ52_9ASTE|nr:hypothetical protein F0562_010476 [Nyssa sinensis]
MAGRMRKFVKEEVITLAYILLYIALSSGQIFFNKKNYLVLQLGKVYIQNSPFGMPRKLNQYQKAYMIVVQSGGLSDFWAARDWYQ